MKEQINLKRNYFFKLSYQILSLIVPLITTPYVSRVLGADGIGIYSYTSSIMTYFTMFASLGTLNYGIREIAQCRDDKEQMSNVFWGIELMTACTTLITLAVWFILICLSSKYRTIFLALTPMLIASAADISWLYTGIEKIHYTVIINFICKLAGVAAVFVFVKDKGDLFFYVLIMSAVTCIGNMSMWFFLPKIVTRLRIKEIKIGIHFRETLKYFITSVAISIYTVLDKTMIGLLTHDSLENGYYEQACKLVNIAKPLAFSSVNDIMAPRMSYLFAKDKKEEITERINFSLGVELLLSVGCCFGLISVADIFVPLFFGFEYEPVIPLLRLMSPILIFICISTCFGSHYYVPSGNILDGSKLTIIGSIVNIFVNAPMIILFKANGAVAASLIAEGVIAILYAVSCKSKVKYMGIWRQLYKKLIAGVLMCILCLWIGAVIKCTPILLLLIQVVSGAVFYIMLLTVLKDNSVMLILKMIKSKIGR